MIYWIKKWNNSSVRLATIMASSAYIGYMLLIEPKLLLKAVGIYFCLDSIAHFCDLWSRYLDYVIKKSKE